MPITVCSDACCFKAVLCCNEQTGVACFHWLGVD